MELLKYSSTDMQDLIISKRILNGERKLFELLIRPHNESLYRAIRGVLKDERVIETVMMSSYSFTFRNLYRYYGQCSFRTWLIGIGVQEALKVANNSPVEDYAKSEKEYNHLEEIIDNIPGVARITFVLKKLLKQSTKDISQWLHVPEKEVKINSLLAQKQLKKHYRVSYQKHNIFRFESNLLIKRFLSEQETSSGEVDLILTNAAVQQTNDANQNAMLLLRQEHQENLMLCKKIRNGFQKGIELDRIKRYTDWYWRNRLLMHFNSEEQMIFPVLGKENVLVKKAMSEHRRLRRLFESREDIHKMLNRIEEELESHVRFEEKVLFKEIENRGNAKALKTIETLHKSQETAEANWPDEFWK